MFPTSKAPFGMNSVVPELQDAPVPESKDRDRRDDIPDSLRLSEDDMNTMQSHLEAVSLDRNYYDYSIIQQQRALELFSKLQLYIPTQDERDVQSKFSIQKTDRKYRNPRGTKDKNRWRRHTRIYQCQCGVDHTAGRRAAKDNNRQTPWKNVGCWCWIRLVTTHDERSDGVFAINEITGILDHSDACSKIMKMDRNPRVPLHPDLRDYALSLLRKNSPLSLLRSEKIKFGNLPGDTHYRFQLTTYDSSSLYRTLARERGIPQCSAAEANLDTWFRSEKPLPPSPLLTESLMHYQAHQEPVTDRFEIIICTPQQRVAAWKYGHKQQVLMDLTFGVCSARALLVILMALDEGNSGIPIGFMMFTARKHAKATHADYDTKVLDNLLASESMGKNEAGEAFEISVGNTDNDTWECTALAKNWGNILLILCLFHVWQAWRNGLNKSLRSIPRGDGRKQVRDRLGKFLMRLLKDIDTHANAVAEYDAELRHWQQVQKKRHALSKTQANAAIKFLAYLKSYIALESYWVSWSPAGAIEAARRLRVPVNRIARTNNALESFNGRIKGKYYKPYQHSGRLPRIDTWILLLITAVMPDFFQEREDTRRLRDYYRDLRTVPGPQHTLSTSDSLTTNSGHTSSSSSTSTSSNDSFFDESLVKQWLDELEIEDCDDTDESDDHDDTSPTSQATVDREEACNAEPIIEEAAIEHEEPSGCDAANNVDHMLQAWESTSESVGRGSSQQVSKLCVSHKCHFDDMPHELKLQAVPVWRHCHRSQSLEIIPDSQELEFNGDTASAMDCNNFTYHDDIALNESAIWRDLHSSDSRSRRSHHPNLPALSPQGSAHSPRSQTTASSPRMQSPKPINEIGNAMMRLQVAEDTMLRELKLLAQLDPASEAQLQRYISPSVRARLDASTLQSFFSSQHFDIEPATSPKEKRKESHAIR
ncbi:hypothetical protein FPV67DRAFT_1568228 [Lyophyllum atratum]|nr:hypothetical protein FPV67DRAFT_1568228 [Lyophyllum atratum]